MPGRARSFGRIEEWKELVAKRFFEPNGRTHKLLGLVTS
jgi:hypothetical protein